MQRFTSTLIRSLLFAGLALQARSALAQSQSTGERMVEHLGPVSPGTGAEFFRAGNYVDFSATSTDPNRAWKTWNVSPNGTASQVVKYGSVVVYGQGVGNTGNPPECIEIYTEQAMASTVNGDTKMYLYDPNGYKNNPSGTLPQGGAGTYTSVSDDWGGTLYSKVRVFWGGPTTALAILAVRISPFSTSSNNIDFGVTWRRLNYSTADDCRTQGLTAPTNFVDASAFPTKYWITASL